MVVRTRYTILRKRSTSLRTMHKTVGGCSFTLHFRRPFCIGRELISVHCLELRGVCFSEVRNVLVLWSNQSEASDLSAVQRLSAFRTFIRGFTVHLCPKLYINIHLCVLQDRLYVWWTPTTTLLHSMREELKSSTVGSGVQSVTTTGSLQMLKWHVGCLDSLGHYVPSPMPFTGGGRVEYGWTMWSVLGQRLTLWTAVTAISGVSPQTVWTTIMMLEWCALMVGLNDKFY